MFTDDHGVNATETNVSFQDSQNVSIPVYFDKVVLKAIKYINETANETSKGNEEDDFFTWTMEIAKIPTKYQTTEYFEFPQYGMLGL